jgi:predicted negative regulator of RcsB-dependent stress response
MKKNNDLIDPKEKGTSKRTIKSVEKPHMKNDVNRLVLWLDRNVLPLIALVVISGLAVVGLREYLPEMNETTQLVASILAVSVLVVKLQAGKVN